MSFNTISRTLLLCLVFALLGPSTLTASTPGCDASFFYTDSVFCVSGANPIPTIVTPGVIGTFSADPSVVIDPFTGEIDLASSVPGGPYTITFSVTSPCVDTDFQTIYIEVDQDPTFFYPSPFYCPWDPDPIPVFVATPGGTFTSVPPGLFLNPASGTLDLSTSTPGVYTVTYTLPDPCANSSSVTITIDTIADATIAYADTVCCTSDPNPIPTFIATPGGVFTEASGSIVFVNTTTGEIDCAASLPGGTYCIDYTPPTTCPGTFCFEISIYTDEPAYFDFTPTVVDGASGDTLCPDTVLNPSGVYTATPPGLAISPLTGCIDLGASTTDTFEVTFTADGPCGNSWTDTLVISPMTGIQSLEEDGVRLYPNPFTQSSRLELMDAYRGAIQVQIMDLKGKILREEFHVNAMEIRVDRNALSSGLYILSVIHPETGRQKSLLMAIHNSGF